MNKNPKKIRSIFFILIAIVLIVLSLIGLTKEDEEYLSTEGTIVNIEEYYDPIEEESEYSTYIDYEVQGKEYKNVEYGAYNSDMKIGDKVEVLYSPNNPELIQTPNHKVVPYIVLAISLIALAAGLISYKK